MNRLRAENGCKPPELFCLRFKRRMRDLLARHQSAAEAFGPAFEETLNEVALDDDEQGQVYRELIAWAGAAKLFTDANTIVCQG